LQLKKGDLVRASQLAFEGNIVTPDTSAVIAFMPEANSPWRSGDANAPSLIGATTGTIGPQGTDATYVTGVNTSGTVRVNNLANLEAMLNIICNCTEILGILGGGILIVSAICSSGKVTVLGLKLTRMQAVATGVTIGIVGLATPGIVNWMVASARDANLFS
jgi:hypothetical protein